MSVVGSDFTAQSFVRWNGASLPTRYVNERLVMATVPARALARNGVGQVSVFDPETGLSNPLHFTILSRAVLERGRRMNRRTPRPKGRTRQQ